MHFSGRQPSAASLSLADWSISETAMKMYNSAYAVVGIPGLAKPVKFFPKETLSRMIKNDFAWAAANRKTILAEWQKRYDSKSDPK